MIGWGDTSVVGTFRTCLGSRCMSVIRGMNGHGSIQAPLDETLSSKHHRDAAGKVRMAGTDLVFPAPRGGTLSDMTLTAVVRRMKVAAVPHGSTFRDWASERTNYPRDVAEMALA